MSLVWSGRAVVRHDGASKPYARRPPPRARAGGAGRPAAAAPRPAQTRVSCHSPLFSFILRAPIRENNDRSSGKEWRRALVCAGRPVLLDELGRAEVARLLGERSPHAAEGDALLG